MYTDDTSLSADLVVYRRIQPSQAAKDMNGEWIISDGAFRTDALSVFRADRVTPSEVLKNNPNDGVAEITVGEIRAANCIVMTDEPPPGHICAYRRDQPKTRISGGNAAKMSRAAKLTIRPMQP
jgi:hypothetical protein